MSKRTALIAAPRDPNCCAIYFPKIDPTAGPIIVGLQSLLRQVEKIPPERVVKQIAFLESERRLMIEFEGEPH